MNLKSSVQAPDVTIRKVKIGSILLESGKQLDDVELAYESAGSTTGPVILVCHALTGSQYAVGTEKEPGWWAGLIGSGQYVDTSRYRVLTFNVLGGCSGSTGPRSVCKKSGQTYRADFPHISVRDMVRAQKKALEVLGISELFAVMGGSLGGMQVFEWGVMYPSFMKKLFVFASSPYLSDYGIAFNRIGITAICNDPAFNGGDYTEGAVLKGLEIARMAGLVTYRTPALFDGRFRREEADDGERPYYQVESYLNYQGEKLAKRFDANSYLSLLYAMNAHDIGAGRGGWEQASNTIQAEFYAFGFEGDLLYDPDVLRACASTVKSGHYFHVETLFGHDGFLTEYDRWGGYVSEALEN
ncbi:homoserine O-acetyltransferase [Fictibacillus iocasae]|uniref:Homoserine O-acetyltransferase n=1 Tax=Fictibacillus iocasae TaxID=2715437 RepID=A0ABW2NLC0_9BACL